MRMTSMVAGLAIVAGSMWRGKEELRISRQRLRSSRAARPRRRRPRPQGATHDVNMVLEGSNYKYVPAELTVGPNDVVRYHNKSGGPHNVAFWQDSIPYGAASHIVLPDPMAPLSSKLVVAPDEVIEVKLNDAPKGAYKFHCTPHLALGMKGKLEVK